MKMKIEKLRDIYRSKYLITQHELLTRLCLIPLFTTINFFINQTVIKIDTHEIN
jgi:hypothetical protein